ncbi:MAG: histidine phosphatase family protein [Phycisphaerales bacterium]|nr:histidine phosphatase family protein [Phycisphaerales bacterium]
MPRLLLMRHAKSSWSDPRTADHDRPLNDRGLKAAPRMGRWLQSQGIQPDRVLSSTANRAASTAELVAATFEVVPPVDHFRDLYHAATDDILELLATEAGDAEVVLLVAHNPGIEDFVSRTTSCMEFCPTAVIAVIDFTQDWSDLVIDASGTLAALWRPKELPKE